MGEMGEKMRPAVLLSLFLFCLLLLIVAFGCTPGAQQVGTYVAETGDSFHGSEATLELKDTGAGVWKVGDDEVAFSWHVKGSELRLYTKNGGIIVGSLDNRLIHVTLPGSMELLFRKVK